MDVNEFPEEWQPAIQQLKNIIDTSFSEYLKQCDKNPIKARKKVIKRITKIVQKQLETEKENS